MFLQDILQKLYNKKEDKTKDLNMRIYRHRLVNEMVTRTENLVKTLKDLQSSTPDIEASALVSVDGLMIASALPQDVEEDRVAAMSAAMLSLGERTANELARGELEQVYVKGTNGYILLMAVGEAAVLTGLARQNAKLGLIFLDMKRTAEAAAKII